MILHQRGNVVIGSISWIVDHDDVKVWEVRLRTKYPDVQVYEGGGEKNHPPYAGVWLAAKNGSENPDLRYKRPTELRYEIPEGETWNVFAYRGLRYVQIAAYRGGSARSE